MSSRFARAFASVALVFGAALPLSALDAQAGMTTPADSSAVRAPHPTNAASRSSVDSLSVAGPRMVRAGVSAPLASQPVAAASQGNDAQVGAGSNVAMMGVGVAAIVVGSLIGGDSGTIIAVGGGVIGLIGLFRYLR